MNKQLEEKKNKFREKKIKNKEKGAGQKRDDKNEDTKFPVPEHKPVTLEWPEVPLKTDPRNGTQERFVPFMTFNL